VGELSSRFRQELWRIFLTAIPKLWLQKIETFQSIACIATLQEHLQLLSSMNQTCKWGCRWWFQLLAARTVRA